jgi:hypothetical protein
MLLVRLSLRGRLPDRARPTAARLVRSSLGSPIITGAKIPILRRVRDTCGDVEKMPDAGAGRRVQQAKRPIDVDARRGREEIGESDPTTTRNGRESGRVHDAINAFQRLAEAFTRGEVALHPLHIGFGSWPARQEAHGSALRHQTHDEVAAQVAGRACNQDDALAADHVRSHVLEKRHCVDQIGGREALRESDAHRCQKVVPLPSAVPAWPSPKAFRSAAM